MTSLWRRTRRRLGRLRRRVGGVRRLLPGTYAGVRTVEGGSLQAGKAYHDIPGERGAVYRTGSADRAAHIVGHVDVNGLSGVDIGCSVGGLSFALAAHGARMTGVDYDRSSIETARRVAERRGVDIEFVHADLASDATWHRITAGQFDFAVWLSQWMWLNKQVGPERARLRLRQLSEAVPLLVFETAEGPDDGDAGTADVVGPEGVRRLLEESTAYASIVEIGQSPGDWLDRRTVFLCSTAASGASAY